MNWYDVLGVAPGASADEVRSAYRAAIRALHPDTRAPSVAPADADAAVRLLNDAWAVLGDPVRRAAYDERGERPGSPEGDGDPWLPDGPGLHGRRFPWWILALAVLLVIFVLTAYAGGPTPAPPGPVTGR